MKNLTLLDTLQKIIIIIIIEWKKSGKQRFLKFGCKECTNVWYEGVDGLSKKCLYCNEPKGYAFTFQFKGMDEFFVGVWEWDLTMCEENSAKR